jgi:hypothetical protein
MQNDVGLGDRTASGLAGGVEFVIFEMFWSHRKSG